MLTKRCYKITAYCSSSLQTYAKFAGAKLTVKLVDWTWRTITGNCFVYYTQTIKANYTLGHIIYSIEM